MKIPNYYGVKSLNDIDPREGLEKDLIKLGANPLKATTFALDAGSGQYESFDEIISNNAIKHYLGAKVNPIKVRDAYDKWMDPITDMFMAEEHGNDYYGLIKAEDKKARKKGWK